MEDTPEQPRRMDNRKEESSGESGESIGEVEGMIEEPRKVVYIGDTDAEFDILGSPPKREFLWEWERNEEIRHILATIIKGLRVENWSYYAANLFLGLWLIFVANNRQFFMFNVILSSIFVIAYESLVDQVIGRMTDSDNNKLDELFWVIEKAYKRTGDILKHLGRVNYFVRFVFGVIGIVSILIFFSIVTGRMILSSVFVLIVVLPPIHKYIRLKNLVNRLGEALNAKSLKLLERLKAVERLLGEEDEGINDTPVFSPLSVVKSGEPTTVSTAETCQQGKEVPNDAATGEGSEGKGDEAVSASDSSQMFSSSLSYSSSDE